MSKEGQPDPLENQQPQGQPELGNTDPNPVDPGDSSAALQPSQGASAELGTPLLSQSARVAAGLAINPPVAYPASPAIGHPKYALDGRFKPVEARPAGKTFEQKATNKVADLAEMVLDMKDIIVGGRIAAYRGFSTVELEEVLKLNTKDVDGNLVIDPREAHGIAFGFLQVLVDEGILSERTLPQEAKIKVEEQVLDKDGKPAVYHDKHAKAGQPVMKIVPKIITPRSDRSDEIVDMDPDGPEAWDMRQWRLYPNEVVPRDRTEPAHVIKQRIVDAIRNDAPSDLLRDVFTRYSAADTAIKQAKMDALAHARQQKEDAKRMGSNYKKHVSLKDHIKFRKKFCEDRSGWPEWAQPMDTDIAAVRATFTEAEHFREKTNWFSYGRKPEKLAEEGPSTFRSGHKDNDGTFHDHLRDFTKDNLATAWSRMNSPSQRAKDPAGYAHIGPGWEGMLTQGLSTAQARLTRLIEDNATAQGISEDEALAAYLKKQKFPGINPASTFAITPELVRSFFVRDALMSQYTGSNFKMEKSKLNEYGYGGSRAWTEWATVRAVDELAAEAVPGVAVHERPKPNFGG